MRKLISSLALFLVITSNANANDYTVQVGAYKSLTEQAIEQAQGHGDVFHHRGNDNLERLYIGRFNNRRDANSMRDSLLASGFEGAFITKLNESSVTTSQTTQTFSQPTNLTQNASTLKNVNRAYTLEDLNQDERLKASYLDGELRILSEGNFYTVEQYRQNRY